MKKLTLSIISSLILTVCINAEENWQSIESLNEHFNNLETIKSQKIKIISNKQIGNTELYVLKGVQSNNETIEFILDSKGQYIILNGSRGLQVVDLKNNEMIKPPFDIRIIKSKPEAFTYGTGKKHLYVFTDPECPYCQKFEEKWESIKNDVTLHIYFYNMPQHKEANNMTKYILSAKSNDEKAKRLNEIVKGNTDYKRLKLSQEEEKKLDKYIDDVKKIGNKIKLEGVPTVFDENGNMVNWADLVKLEK